MSKLFSYIFPVTKKVQSNFNGILEITWYNGKKHLDAPNANYSYGNLQKVLRFGLQKIDLTNVKHVLLLGLGGGSVIETLRCDFQCNAFVTAIELDHKIIEIAKTEFGWANDPNLTMVCEDAYTFVKGHKDLYDLVIVDLFIDTKVPDKFLEPVFWEDVIKVLSIGGTLLFNASMEQNDRIKIAAIMGQLEQNSLNLQLLENVLGINTLVLAKKPDR